MISERNEYIGLLGNVCYVRKPLKEITSGNDKDEVFLFALISFYFFS